MIDWKEYARHQRHLLKLSEDLEVTLKRRLGQEHQKRVTLVNAMSDLLPRIVDYGWCCEGIGGHAEDCPYIAALAAVAEAGKSVDERVQPAAITFTCHHCGEFFDEPMDAFVATASVTVLAPTLCKDCGHGEDD
jgi:hypothetical protein